MSTCNVSYGLLFLRWLSKEHGTSPAVPSAMLSKCQSIEMDNLVRKRKGTKVQPDSWNGQKRASLVSLLLTGTLCPGSSQTDGLKAVIHNENSPATRFPMTEHSVIGVELVRSTVHGLFIAGERKVYSPVM